MMEVKTEQKNTRPVETEFPNLKIIHFETNVGYGRALLSSIQNSKGKFILTIDSDGQFDISDLNKLIEKQKTEDYDLVTGFRLKKRFIFKSICRSNFKFNN